MTAYILRRLLFMIPTLLGIITITFLVIQFVPGGPIDQMKSNWRGGAGTMTEAGGGALDLQGVKAQEMDPKYLEELKNVNLEDFAHLCQFDCTATKKTFEILSVFPLPQKQGIEVWSINHRKEIIQLQTIK